MSKRSVFDGKKAIRGGVPFVFPIFGPSTVMPQHGFARISRFAASVLTIFWATCAGLDKNSKRNYFVRWFQINVFQKAC